MFEEMCSWLYFHIILKFINCVLLFHSSIFLLRSYQASTIGYISKFPWTSAKNCPFTTLYKNFYKEIRKDEYPITSTYREALHLPSLDYLIFLAKYLKSNYHDLCIANLKIFKFSHFPYSLFKIFKKPFLFNSTFTSLVLLQEYFTSSFF